jgi:alkanesulfonate monooxygenase SsuD/methylene tetrahydromethanopterin reductase-like flavin-dependent oxidoreductase (luciferase family)
MLKRPTDELRQRLLVGPAQECAEKLAAYQSAGAHRIMLWPVSDEIHQLEWRSFKNTSLPRHTRVSPERAENNKPKC